MTGSLVARATLGTSPLSRAASPSAPGGLSIDASLGDAQIALKRRHWRPELHFLAIHFTSVFTTAATQSDDPGPQPIDLRATITGADARLGSLLYALAWAGDTDPLRSVRALGYDIDVRQKERHYDALKTPFP